jgi:hypothetical protein
VHEGKIVGSKVAPMAIFKEFPTNSLREIFRLFLSVLIMA